MSETERIPNPMFDAIAKAFRHFSDFEGRSSRSDFWWYALAYAIVLAMCGVFNSAGVSLTALTMRGSLHSVILSSISSILTSLFVLAVLVPSLAIGVRRLRDAGHHWGHIFWLLLPFVGLIILAVLWSQPTGGAAAPGATAPVVSAPKDPA